MTPRQLFAAAVRDAAPGGKIPQEAIGAFDAFADALGIPRDVFVTSHKLGALSERFETGGRGPATVSSGKSDPGGVSYGSYQLSSQAGTLAQFLLREGDRWRAELQRGGTPGSGGFSRAWEAIAKREPGLFGDAQHAFIERTHYRPAVAAVLRDTGVDLDKRGAAVRDATWSTSVQHGGAARILADAVRAWKEGPDEALLRAIYSRRSEYVRGVAAGHGGTTRAALLGIVDHRYPAELAAALAMNGGG